MRFKHSECRKLFIYFIFKNNEVNPKFLLGLQKLPECAWYINYKEAVKVHLKTSDIMNVFQYEITTDQEHKKILEISNLLEEYNLTHRPIFTTPDLPPEKLFNIKNFSGYWQFSKNNATNEINGIFQTKASLRQVFDEKFSSELIHQSEIIHNNIFSSQYRLGIDILLTLGTTILANTFYSPFALLVFTGCLIKLINDMHLHSKILENDRNTFQSVHNKFSMFSKFIEESTELVPLNNDTLKKITFDCQ